jgi:hypothetical protein
MHPDKSISTGWEEARNFLEDENVGSHVLTDFDHKKALAERKGTKKNPASYPVFYTERMGRSMNYELHIEPTGSSHADPDSRTSQYLFKDGTTRYDKIPDGIEQEKL